MHTGLGLSAPFAHVCRTKFVPTRHRCCNGLCVCSATVHVVGEYAKGNGKGFTKRIALTSEAGMAHENQFNHGNKLDADYHVGFLHANPVRIVACVTMTCATSASPAPRGTAQSC